MTSHRMVLNLGDKSFSEFKRSETILETYETWAAGFPVTAKKKLPLEELSKQLAY